MLVLTPAPVTAQTANWTGVDQTIYPTVVTNVSDFYSNSAYQSFVNPTTAATVVVSGTNIIGHYPIVSNFGTVNALNIIGADLTIDSGKELTVLGLTNFADGTYYTGGGRSPRLLGDGKLIATGGIEWTMHPAATPNPGEGNVSMGGGASIKYMPYGSTPGIFASNIIGTGAYTLTSPGNVETTYSGQLTGTGLVSVGGDLGFVSNSSAKFILTGDNSSKTGGFSIFNGSTLAIGAGGTTGSLGSGGVSVEAGSKLLFNRSDDITVSNVISGGGGLTKQGANVLTLTGANTYSGATGIEAGTLKIGTGSLASSSTVTVLTGATLAFDTNTDQTFANVVTGAGNFTKQGTGILTLTGANTYTGTTRVEAGTLKLGTGGSLSAQSTLVVLAGATFDVGANNQTIASLSGVGGSLTGSGALAVQLAANETVSGNPLSGFASFDKAGAATLTLDGNLNFTGQVKVSGGKLILSGSNTLTGGIQVSGNLVLGSNNAAGGAGNTITTTGSTVTLADGVNSATPIVINSNTTKIEVVGAGNATQSGVISETAGPRPLEKIGTGTLVLDAANTYSGRTTISAGTVRISAANNLGNDSTTNSVALGGGTLDGAGATVTMNRPLIVTNAGGTITTTQSITFQGSNVFLGTLTKAGTGTLTLNGSATDAGGINVTAGILALGDNNAAGSGTITLANSARLRGMTNGMNIANNIALTGGSATVERIGGAAQYTLSGVISGAGGLLKSQDGIIDLTGKNTFTGGVTLGAGTLGVGSDTALGTGQLTAEINTTLRAVNNVTLANNIQLTAGKSITNQFTVDTNGFNMTLSGVISTNVPQNELNQPGLTKNGAGTLTLTGTNTYRGATIINAGTLVVNGSIANTSSVTIANGAKLGGNAAIPNLTVQSGARISPGNSIGTVTIAGNLTLNAGSITEIEIQQNLSDRIIVGGTASLAGTLQLVALGGPYVFATPYTIITAAGGRTGTFATVNTDAAFGVGVTSTVTYNPNDVTVTLNAAPLVQALSLSAMGISRPLNVVAVAAGMDRAVAAGGNASPFFNIYNQPNIAALTAAVNSLSGEVHASASAIGFKSSDQFLRVLFDPTNIGRNAQIGLGSGVSVWGAAYAQTGRTNGESDVGSARRSVSDWNMAFGADVAVHPTTILGVAVSGGQATASLADRLGNAKANVFQVGVSSMSRFGAFSLNLAGSWSILDVDTDRTVPTLGGGAALANYQTQVWSGRAETAYAAWSLSDSFTISPFAALQASSAHSPGFVERVNGSVAAYSLAVNGKRNSQVRSELGIRLDVGSLGPSGMVKIYTRAAWAYYLANGAAVSASLAGLPGSTFKVTGARPAPSSALLGFGADVNLGSGLTFGAAINGELAGRQNSIGASAKFRKAF